MVKIYTDENRIPKKVELIAHPEVHFSYFVRAEDLDKEDCQLLEELTGYRRIKDTKLKDCYYFQSEFDSRIIRTLPRGISVLLLVRLIKRDFKRYIDHRRIISKRNQSVCINASACNQTILERIFVEIDNTNMSLYLRQNDVLNCKDREYRVNRKKAYTAVELKNLLIEQLEKE